MKKLVHFLTVVVMVAVIAITSTATAAKAAPPPKAYLIASPEAMIDLGKELGLIKSATTMEEFNPTHSASHDFISKLCYAAANGKTTTAKKAREFVFDQYFEAVMKDTSLAPRLLADGTEGKYTKYSSTGTASYAWAGVTISMVKFQGYGDDAWETKLSNLRTTVRNSWKSIRTGKKMTRIEALHFVIEALFDDVNITVSLLDYPDGTA